mgnify:CR=1 FL=1
MGKIKHCNNATLSLVPCATLFQCQAKEKYNGPKKNKRTLVEIYVFVYILSLIVYYFLQIL